VRKEFGSACNVAPAPEKPAAWTNARSARRLPVQWRVPWAGAGRRSAQRERVEALRAVWWSAEPCAASSEGGLLTWNGESRNEAERSTKTSSSESSSGVLTGRAAAAAPRIMMVCGRAIVPRMPTMREAAGAAQYAGRVPGGKGPKGAARRTRRRGQGRRARSQSDVMVIVATSHASECGGRGKGSDRLFHGSQRCDLDRYLSKAWERKVIACHCSPG
jgi:hypothetical protein